MTQGHDIPPPDHTVPPVPPRVHNGFNSCLAAGLGTGPAAPMSVLRAALRSRGSEGSVSADQLGKRVAELGPDRNQVTTHHRDNQKRQGWEGEGREGGGGGRKEAITERFLDSTAQQCQRTL